MIAESYGYPWLKINLPFQAAVHFAFRKEPFSKENYNILLLHTEPSEIRMSASELNATWQDFDLIISHDEAHKIYPNVRTAYYWETVVDALPVCKNFEISSIISIGGGPGNMSGYQVRDSLYQRRNEIKTPAQFYMSTRLPNWQQYGLPPLPSDKKNAMFNSMFHIAIENTIQKDYFSEKILDCFNGYSVPIYRGCTNLEDHGLDTRAIIRFNTMDECIERCNSLTANDYYERLEYVIHNRKVLMNKPFWQREVESISLQAWAAGR
jgi:Glycosyltransferase family 10 (fucosyltransferase) C-term